MKKRWVILSTVPLFLLDRFAKSWAIHSLNFHFIELCFLRLHLVKNSGSIFGVGKNWGEGWLVVSSGIFFAIVFYLYRNYREMDFWEFTGFCFIIPGAVSNILDRILFGAVIDFIDFKIWPVFNFADTWITIGVLILAVKFIGEDGKSYRRTDIRV